MAITKEHTSSDHATDIPGNNEEALELGTTRNDRSNEGSGISPENNKMIEQAKEEQRIIRGWRVSRLLPHILRSVMTR